MVEKIILPLIVGGVGLYAVNKFMGNKPDTSGDTVRDAGKEVDESKLTQTKIWYSRTADYIQTLTGAGPMNSDRATKIVMRLAGIKNKQDWLFLIKKFGSRTEIPFYWNENIIRILEMKLNKETFKIRSKKTGKILKGDALETLKRLFVRRGFDF